MNAQLSQLFSPTSRLADVPPDFQGLPWRKWWMLQISEQAEAWRRSLPADYVPPLTKQRLWNPRDSYGWKSL